MKEFASVRGVFNDNSPPLVFLLEDNLVTISGAAGEEASVSKWAEYFKSDEGWEKHQKTESPLSSLFRGAYLDVDRHPHNGETARLYEEMLDELRLSGRVRTVVVTSKPPK